MKPHSSRATAVVALLHGLGPAAVLVATLQLLQDAREKMDQTAGVGGEVWD